MCMRTNKSIGALYVHPPIYQLSQVNPFIIYTPYNEYILLVINFRGFAVKQSVHEKLSCEEMDYSATTLNEGIFRTLNNLSWLEGCFISEVVLKNSSV